MFDYLNSGLAPYYSDYFLEDIANIKNISQFCNGKEQPMVNFIPMVVEMFRRRTFRFFSFNGAV